MGQMKMQKVKLLELTKVYHLNDIKAPPFAEIPADTEVEMIKISIKGWKPWVEIKLPDGSKGLIPRKTKMQLIDIERIQHEQTLRLSKITSGGFLKIMMALMSDDPQSHGIDLVEGIREYEDMIIDWILKKKNPERVIINCSEAGADWMLQETVIHDERIKYLISKAYKNNRSSLIALLHIEQAQSRKLIDDELISHILKEVQREVPWYKTKKWSTIELTTIEIFRKDGEMVPHIIQNYDNRAVNYQLQKITWDDRIVNFLMKKLRKELEELWWRVVPVSLVKSVLEENTGLFAAEQLIVIGKEKEIRRVVLRAWSIYNKRSYRHRKKMVEWCVKHYSVLSEYLLEYLENEEMRYFIVLILASVRDKKCIDALKTLQNDPSKAIRKIVEKTLRTN
jgi:hypothetical protein